MPTSAQIAKAEADSSSEDRSTRKLILAAIAVAGMLAVVTMLRDPLGAALNSFQAWMGEAGWLGIIAYILAYTVGTVLMVPGWILTVGAGLTYGLAAGTALVSAASVLGATASYLIAQHLVRESVERKISGDPRFVAIDRAIAERGWKMVFLLRLSPALPFNLMNYALGLTRIRLRHYVVASWLGMLPGTVMYVYLGSLGEFMISERERTPMETAMMIGGLIATVVVSVWLARIARDALRLERPAVESTRKNEGDERPDSV